MPVGGRAAGDAGGQLAGGQGAAPPCQATLRASAARPGAPPVLRLRPGGDSQGLIDAHVLLIPGGLSLSRLDLRGAAAKAEFVAAVCAAAGKSSCNAPAFPCKLFIQRARLCCTLRRKLSGSALRLNLSFAPLLPAPLRPPLHGFWQRAVCSAACCRPAAARRVAAGRQLGRVQVGRGAAGGGLGGRLHSAEPGLPDPHGFPHGPCQLPGAEPGRRGRSDARPCRRRGPQARGGAGLGGRGRSGAGAALPFFPATLLRMCAPSGRRPGLRRCLLA